MVEQQLDPDRAENLIPNPYPPEERRPGTFFKSSDRTISNGQKKSNTFSILTKRFRVFVFPPAPQDDPLSTASQGFSLSRLRSRNKRSTTNWQASTSALPKPTVATAPIEELSPAATTTRDEGNQNNEITQVDIQHPIDGASPQEPVDQRSLGRLNEFEQLQDFFVASKMEVPEELHKEWEKNVLPNLLRDRSTFGTSLGLKTNEINGRGELCMAGSKPSPTYMEPTLIVTSRNENFKRKFGQEIQTYDYIKKLGVEIKMILEENRETSTRKAILPRWAASSGQGAARADPNLPARLTSCEEEQVFGNESACGLRLKFVVDIGGSQMTHHSTLGGLIMIGDKAYGLTTGHSIVISDTGNSDPVQVRSPLASQDSNLMGSPDTLSWRHVSCHPTFVFAGQRFSTSDLQSPVWDDKHTNSDWLLVNINDSGPMENSYQDSSRNRITISEILPLDQLKPGPVLVLSGWERAQAGFLSQNSSILYTDKSVFRVRQIVMHEPIGLGASGSWVVRGSQLCGYIVAIQEGSPKAYMLPIDDVFTEIASATGRHPVRLVSKGHIQTITQQERRSRAGTSSSLLPPRGSDNVIIPQRLPARLSDVPRTQFTQTSPTSGSNLRAEPISIRTRLPKLPNVLKPNQRRSGIKEPPRLGRLDSLPVSEQSLLWPTLAILFPSVYTTNFGDRIGFRFLRLAQRSTRGLYVIFLAELVVLVIIALGPAFLTNTYLISFSYSANPHTNTSSQINSTFVTEIANLTRFADLEVRVGYFTLCVRNTTGTLTCGTSLVKSPGLEQDPLDLVSIGAQYRQNEGLRILFLAAGVMSIAASFLLFAQFVIPVRKHVAFYGTLVEDEQSIRPRLTPPSSLWGIFRNPPSPRNTWTHRILLPIITYGRVNVAVICQQVALICLLILVLWQIFSAVGATVTLRAFSGGAVKVQLGGLATGLGWLAVALGTVLFWGLKSTYRVVRIYMDSEKRRDETYEMRERHYLGSETLHSQS